MILWFFTQIKKIMKIKDHCRKLVMTFKRLMLYNHDFTLISNNCIAGCLLHDFGMEFRSPTINLYMPFPDYIRFLKDIQCNVKFPLRYAGFNKEGAPCSLIGGGRIIFLHYTNFVEAANAWYRRVKRINWNNIYFVLVERDGCTYQNLKEFDELPFKHKVALVHRPYDDIQCAFYRQNLNWVTLWISKDIFVNAIMTNLIGLNF